MARGSGGGVFEPIDPASKPDGQTGDNDGGFDKAGGHGETGRSGGMVSRISRVDGQGRGGAGIGALHHFRRCSAGKHRTLICMPPRRGSLSVFPRAALPSAEAEARSSRDLREQAPGARTAAMKAATFSGSFDPGAGFHP